MTHTVSWFFVSADSHCLLTAETALPPNEARAVTEASLLLPTMWETPARSSHSNDVIQPHKLEAGLVPDLAQLFHQPTTV